MQNLSIVIICKNAAGVIGTTLQSFAGLTNDVVVYDNGSSDGTQEIVKQTGANLFSGEWEGFGKTKNKANKLAKHNWILSLDADEAIDDALKYALLQLQYGNEKKVYDLLFKNFIGNKNLRYGQWGDDWHIRLFNRNDVKWNDAVVHEELIIPEGIQIEKLKGFVLHRTSESFDTFKKKMTGYALLNAEKYFKQGKKPWTGQQILSSFFSFLQNYIFRLGFLDGKAGYKSACITAQYTFLKYKKLKETISLNKSTTKQINH